MCTSPRHFASLVRAAWTASALVALILLSACRHDSDDSARTFERLKVLKRSDQFQAAAVSLKLAVVVGGSVVVTSDLQGGDTVRTVLPGTPALIDVAACADGSFVALDFYRKVWLADAAAKAWTPQPIAGTWRPLALACDGQNRIWVVGSGTTIAVSGTRGATWEKHDFKQDAMFNTVQFVDAANGFITGEFGAVYRTTDAGATWNAEPKIATDFYPYAAHFTSASEGYVSGTAGAMLRTRDAGKTWDKLDNPGALPQFGLAQSGSAMVSVGAGGSLQRLDGERWIPLPYATQTPALLRAVAQVSASRLLIAGASGVLQMVPVAPASLAVAALAPAAPLTPASSPIR